MRVALVHDWLTGMRGGERVLVELCRLFPGATVFTLFHRRGSVDWRIEAHPIRTSFLDRIPGVTRHYRSLLPLYPMAAWSLDLTGFDLILSSSHAAAKAVRKPRGSLHVCYCYTPMRYIWGGEADYFHYSDRLGLRRAALGALTGPLRSWDRAAAARVDHFIAISDHIRERIAACYGRSAEVIYPPVDTRFFTPQPAVPVPSDPSDADVDGAREAGFYLAVAALVPPKRLDLAIDAFNRLGRPLVIAGTGPDESALRRRAGSGVRFAGFVRDEELRRLYRSCRALIVPGREDFGLTPLEAQACGRPVVAYAAGGALESVVDGETGILFERQTAESLAEAVERSDTVRFDCERLRTHAEKFAPERFRAAVREALARVVSGSGPGPRAAGRFDIRAGEIARPVAGLAPVRPAETARPRIGEPGSPESERTRGGAPAHPSVRGVRGACKRALDCALALVGLVLLAAPLLVLAALIRLQSSGAALYRQRRVGLRGRTFVMLKLRTMVAGAETGRGPTWAVEDDARCTPLGGFLRRNGLDELPQLWNVLRGEMSLVGPRPERPEFVERFARELPRYRERQAVRGGLTGLAQIRGWRGDTSLEERLRADLDYVTHWSLGRDIAILVATPLAIRRMRRETIRRRARAM